MEKLNIRKYKQVIYLRLSHAYKVITVFTKVLIGSLNKKQRYFVLNGLTLVILLAILLFCLQIKSPSLHRKANRFVVLNAHMANIHAVGSSQWIKYTNELSNLKRELSLMKVSILQRDQITNRELSEISSAMPGLAQEKSLSALKSRLSEPNKQMLNKMQGLQQSINQMLQASKSKIWVKPDLVTKLFKLSAVQGFSDGMRAIIDIDGNQIALTPHEVYPVCQGWVLQQLDFSGQSAIFVKKIGKKRYYVKLEASY